MSTGTTALDNSSVLSPYLSIKELAEELGMRVSVLAELVRQGKFPAGVKIECARCWHIDTVSVNIVRLEGTLIGFGANPPAEQVESYHAFTRLPVARYSPRWYKVSLKSASTGRDGEDE